MAEHGDGPGHICSFPQTVEAPAAPARPTSDQTDVDADQADQVSAQGSSSKTVDNMYQAMQWPTFHTEKMLEHMANRDPVRNSVTSSVESDSDTDDDCEGDPPCCQVPGLKKLFTTFDTVPMSSAFSGIDSPGTGLSQQVAELNHRILIRNLERSKAGLSRRESKLGEPIHLNAVEYFNASQRELMNHPSAPKCLFGDIANFQHTYFRAMKNKLDSRASDVRQVLSGLLKHPQAIKLPEPEFF